MPTGFKVEVGGILAILGISIVIFASGFPDAAWIFSMFGTLLWMFGIVAWIVFVDSKKRWPSKKPFDRFASVVTFDGSTERR